MRNLLAGLKSDRFEITHSEKDSFDAVFFPISYDLEKLRRWKKKGIQIVQRLDGVYYPSKQGPDFAEKNRELQAVHGELADVVVYQSDYSRSQCHEVIGRSCARREERIVNGADAQWFYPGQITQNAIPVLVTTGNFRSADMIEPVVKALDQWQREGKQFKLICVGPIIKDEIREFFERSYLEWKGPMDLAEVGKILREADLFAYSHLNPPCPNSVVEALASGVPVVGFESGSMRELCGFSSELLAPVSDRVLQEYSEFRWERLLEKLNAWETDPLEWRNRAQAQAKNFVLEPMIAQYRKVFEEEIRI